MNFLEMEFLELVIYFIGVTVLSALIGAIVGLVMGKTVGRL